jgi:hypothetical protein
MCGQNHGRGQVGLETPREVSTVFDRERPFAPEVVSPVHESQVFLGRRGDRGANAQLATGTVNRHNRVRALVCVNT